jgi:myo-inositol-1(or 4)-monophosphatase
MTHPGSEMADAALLADVCAVVRDVARDEVMPRYRRVGHHRKSDGTLCTEADLGAQAVLVERLRALLPLPVIGEEMSAEEHLSAWELGAGSVWCVDPVDGTSNFVHGMPWFAVSVALLAAGRPRLGVVYAPATDEMFSALRGRGSRLNGELLGPGPLAPELRAAMANVDFRRIPPVLGQALAAREPYCSHRSLGAATLEWCYLAAGRLDLYLHGGQKLWDYAAGSLVLEEAGGMVGSFEREDFWGGSEWRRSVVATHHPDLYPVWRQWVDEHLGAAATRVAA